MDGRGRACARDGSGSPIRAPSVRAFSFIAERVHATIGMALTEQQQLQLAPRIPLVPSQLSLNLLIDALLLLGLLRETTLHFASFRCRPTSSQVFLLTQRGLQRCLLLLVSHVLAVASGRFWLSLCSRRCCRLLPRNYSSKFTADVSPASHMKFPLFAISQLQAAIVMAR